MTATMSVDGKVTVGPDQLLIDRDAAAQWQSLHPASATSVAAARSALLERQHQPGAVLEGSGTFVTDLEHSPALADPLQLAEDLRTDFLPDAVTERADHDRWFVVVDSRGRVRWRFTRSGGTDLLVLVSSATPTAYLSYLRDEGICYLLAGRERVDLGTALQRLHDVLAVQSVITDGGGRLNAALLSQGLVDELHVLVLPTLIGGAGTPTLVDGDAGAGALPARLRLLAARSEDDGLLWLSYSVMADETDPDPRQPGQPDAVRPST
jgi:riboflavin biosynthesis pyrimidine reductase